MISECLIDHLHPLICACGSKWSFFTSKSHLVIMTILIYRLHQHDKRCKLLLLLSSDQSFTLLDPNFQFLCNFIVFRRQRGDLLMMCSFPANYFLLLFLLFLGGIVNDILSWKAWIPLSRLTYGAYLMHPCVLIWFYHIQEKPIHYQDNLFVSVIFSYFFLIRRHNLVEVNMSGH